MTYNYGDTVRLKATFKTFAGVLTDPSAISLKVFGANDQTTPLTTKAIGDLTKVSTGVFYYDYLIPAQGNFTYEYAGTLESTVSLARQRFIATFV